MSTLDTMPTGELEILSDALGKAIPAYGRAYVSLRNRRDSLLDAPRTRVNRINLRAIEGRRQTAYRLYLDAKALRAQLDQATARRVTVR